MRQKQTLEDMVQDRYADPEIAQAVLDSIAKHGTEQQIMSGEATLPTETDATHWHDRVTGRTRMTPTERSQAEIIKSQDERILRLEQAMKGGEQ